MRRLVFQPLRAIERVVQRAVIEATEEFWLDPANDPASLLSGGPMVGRQFVWCWDARPYPFFPSLTDVWSDGENFRLGHWIEGKIGNMLLSEIVRDLCLRAGLAKTEFDVSALDDEVVGYVVTERKAMGRLGDGASPAGQTRAMERRAGYLFERT